MKEIKEKVLNSEENVQIELEPMFAALTNQNNVKIVTYKNLEKMFKNKTIKEKNLLFKCGFKCELNDEMILFLENGQYIRTKVSNIANGDLLDKKDKVISIVRCDNNENSVWTAENGYIVQSEQYGVYVKLERNDIDSVSMSYGSFSNGAIHADSTAWEGGEYIFMDNDIMYISKDAGAPVLFSITAKQKDGKVVASGNFRFDANQEKMYLTITADGTIVDDTEGYVPDPEEKPTTMEAYATVIGEYYTALSEGWDAAQVMESGLNYMVADSFFENPLEEIGYMVSDLDGDGAQELIIGSMKEDEFFGKMIFSLYTLDGSGVPQLLIDSTERNRYYYAGDIKFANLGSSDWNASFVTTLKLENKELIDMTYTTNPTDYVQMELTSFSRWGE